jgi:hypothetical protein
MGAISLPLKAIIDGVLFVLATWVGIRALHLYTTNANRPRSGASELDATAGGWTFLLHSPAVVVALSTAFGIGFY